MHIHERQRSITALCFLTFSSGTGNGGRWPHRRLKAQSPCSFQARFAWNYYHYYHYHYYLVSSTTRQGPYLGWNLVHRKGFEQRRSSYATQHLQVPCLPSRELCWFLCCPRWSFPSELSDLEPIFRSCICNAPFLSQQTSASLAVVSPGS